MYEKLFSPISINSVTLKNRIAYPSLALLFSYDKKINNKHIEFYRERAKGGAALITVGPVGFDELGSGLIALSIEHDDSISDFKKLTDAIKEENSIPWIQLFHAGAYSMPILIGGKQPIAPSPVYSSYSKTTPKEMTIEDIEYVQGKFVQAARRAKEAGFMGVEIIGSAGYLITQFLSPLTNKRSDEYGGNFQNRMRFATELIAKLRNELGKNFPITMRMAGNDFMPESNDSTKTPEIAIAYENAGIDAISVTGGWHETRVPQLSMDVPRGAFAYLAQNIKNHVSVPVLASNRITDPSTAELILQNGSADIINMARPLLADPYLPKKAKEGKINQIRPCVACSQGCTDQIFSGKPIYCATNPLTGFENERQILETSNPKNILIIGSGPGGMESAITAHAAGHSVELFEAKPEIGGQLILASKIHEKTELSHLLHYYKETILELEIPIYTNLAVTPDMIQQKQPDYVIIAEGAIQNGLPIEHDGSSNILQAWDVLHNDPETGKNIAIIGGGATGLEAALFLGQKGTISPEILHFLFVTKAESPDTLYNLCTTGSKNITIFESTEKIGSGIGKSTKWITIDAVKRYGINIKTNLSIEKIQNNTIFYSHEKEKRSKQFDTIINATGVSPVTTISDKINGLNIPHSIIGDCKKPGRIQDAIHDAFLAITQLH